MRFSEVGRIKATFSWEADILVFRSRDAIQIRIGDSDDEMHRSVSHDEARKLIELLTWAIDPKSRPTGPIHPSVRC